MAPLTYSLARPTASAISIPLASRAAMDEANVQPVPWVWEVTMNEALKCWQSPVSLSQSTSVASADLVWAPVSRWPPLTSTHRGPIAQRSLAACSLAATESMTLPPSNKLASGRFGVIIVAKGKSSDFNVSRKAPTPAWSSACPLVDTMTGSTTSSLRHLSTSFLSSRSPATTAATVSEVASMPVFTTSVPMSPSTERICSLTKSRGTGKMPCTPCEF
mmetsp:Transcript_47987/g.77938  ORF Transcript_47987/g.77938 Transcript_47987/m.77938 type:complete len:218 (-) Transcript_47987:931-1584(-)